MTNYDVILKRSKVVRIFCEEAEKLFIYFFQRQVNIYFFSITHFEDSQKRDEAIVRASKEFHCFSEIIFTKKHIFFLGKNSIPMTFSSAWKRSFVKDAEVRHAVKKLHSWFVKTNSLV